MEVSYFLVDPLSNYQSLIFPSQWYVSAYKIVYHHKFWNYISYPIPFPTAYIPI